MTISTILRVASFALATVLTTTAAMAQRPGDNGSHWEPMFNSTGAMPPSVNVSLLGGAPPVLGQTTQIRLTAPTFSFGFIAVSAGANVGTTLHIGTSPIDFYLDPLLSLGSFALPLPGGFGQLPLQLPPDPALSGLELAFQAAVLNPSGGIAASNLLAGNFGMVPGGPAVFAFNFGGANGVSLSRDNYWPTTTTKNPIVCNATANAKDYTICGEKQSSSGVLEIRDQTGAVLATIPGNQTTFCVSLTVPAGSKLYFYNSGSATINGLKWSIQVG